MTTLPPSDPAAAAASAAQGATPGTSELTQFAPQVPGVPDAATIARLANAFYSGAPSSPMPGPGAALPSAPVFAAEPIYNSLPGVPALQLPLSPNLNPGLPPFPFPASGAAQPSAPVFAVEPLIAQATSAPTPGAVAPLGEKGAPAVPAAPAPQFGATPAAAAPSAPGAFPSAADLASLPSTLGGVMSFVPSFAPERGATPAGLPGAVPGSAYAGPTEGLSFFDRGASPQAGATPFAYQASVLDLTALPYQHVTTLGAPAPAISGVRAFDPHVIRRDFPILDESVNGRPLVWLDNAATTQKPQSRDRPPLATSTSTRTPTSIARRTRSPRARPTPTRARGRRCARSSMRRRRESIVFVRGTTEGINLIAKSLGRTQRQRGRRDRHHAPRAPRQHRAVAAARGREGRQACASRPSTIAARSSSRSTRSSSIRGRASSRSRQVSNALGTITPVAEMVAMAHRHGARRRSSTAPSRCRTCRSTCRRSTPTSSCSPATRCSPRPASASSAASPSILEDMPPWQGGGNMIADVTFEKTVFQGPPCRFEAGTGNIADAVGLGAAHRLPRDHRHEQHLGATSTSCLGYATQGLLTVPGLRIIGTAHEKAGVASFVLDGCRSEDVGKALDREGIAVRSGHHCAQPILRRFGLEVDGASPRSRSTIRPRMSMH